MSQPSPPTSTVSMEFYSLLYTPMCCVNRELRDIPDVLIGTPVCMDLTSSKSLKNSKFTHPTGCRAFQLGCEHGINVLMVVINGLHVSWTNIIQLWKGYLYVWFCGLSTIWTLLPILCSYEILLSNWGQHSHQVFNYTWLWSISPRLYRAIVRQRDHFPLSGPQMARTNGCTCDLDQ